MSLPLLFFFSLFTWCFFFCHEDNILWTSRQEVEGDKTRTCNQDWCMKSMSLFDFLLLGLVFCPNLFLPPAGFLFPLTYPGCAGRQKDSWCKDFKLVRNDHETNEREENNAMIRMSCEGGIYILLLLMMLLFRKYVSDFLSSKWVFFPSRLISESDHWTWTNQPEYSCAPYLAFPTLHSLSFHSLFGCINPCLLFFFFLSSFASLDSLHRRLCLFLSHVMFPFPGSLYQSVCFFTPFSLLFHPHQWM